METVETRAVSSKFSAVTEEELGRLLSIYNLPAGDPLLFWWRRAPFIDRPLPKLPRAEFPFDEYKHARMGGFMLIRDWDAYEKSPRRFEVKHAPNTSRLNKVIEYRCERCVTGELASSWNQDTITIHLHQCHGMKRMRYALTRKFLNVPKSARLSGSTLDALAAKLIEDRGIR